MIRSEFLNQQRRSDQLVLRIKASRLKRKVKLLRYHTHIESQYNMHRASSASFKGKLVDLIPKKKPHTKHTLSSESKIYNLKPADVLHPFINVSQFDISLLCMTERCPQLFDGKEAVPAIMQSETSDAKELKNMKFKFHTVYGIYHWIKEFTSNRELSLQPLEFINEIAPPLPTVKLNLQALEHGWEEMTLEHLFMNINDSPENIILWILQNRPDRYNVVMSGMLPLIGTYLDHLEIIELVIQQLLKISQEQSDFNEEENRLFEKLLKAVEDRFGGGYSSVFNIHTVIQLLKFHLKNGNLNQCKTYMSEIIGMGFCPSSHIVNQYLSLIDEQITEESHSDPNSRRVVKFAYIADFSMVLEKTLTAENLSILIDYCIHPTEVFDLLTIFERTGNHRLLSEQCGVKLIGTLSQLTDSYITNCCNLSTLLHKMKAYYEGPIPALLVETFISAYLENYNYSMAATLYRTYDFVNKIPDRKLKKSESSLPGFTETDRKKFMELCSITTPV
ncbi:HDR154Wp [Eremothecium sinecaudum]|uniref:ATPase expression protein 1 n=1 Tax=Eremothecium sinecaudum TaxID=45286 RepID=A0A109UX73_9SACH|nr:HDR154Wp [Eremothecium sinecaudum]AMD20896.1 HDR154Wp [Eremothecium sinecaudum]